MSFVFLIFGLKSNCSLSLIFKRLKSSMCKSKKGGHQAAFFEAMFR